MGVPQGSRTSSPGTRDKIVDQLIQRYRVRHQPIEQPLVCQNDEAVERRPEIESAATHREGRRVLRNGNFQQSKAFPGRPLEIAVGSRAA